MQLPFRGRARGRHGRDDGAAGGRDRTGDLREVHGRGEGQRHVPKSERGIAHLAHSSPSDQNDALPHVTASAAPASSLPPPSLLLSFWEKVGVRVAWQPTSASHTQPIPTDTKKGAGPTGP